MKVIDLLNKITNGEQIISFEHNKELYIWDEKSKWYLSEPLLNYFTLSFDNLNDEITNIKEDIEEKPLTKKDFETLGYACGEIKKCIEKGFNKSLNNEPLEDDDKDIPLIPDDELIILKQEKAIDMQKAIDYNFKVLKEKINQVAEEFNEYRKGKE